MALTHENMDFLKSRFKADQHEFLQGNAYITEAAITDRIEAIDPSWELRIQRIDPRPSEGETKGLIVTVQASMTINGVTRDGVGMAVVSLKKDGKTEANEAEKSAATDAMKRAARLFGIGRYLLDLPDYVKDVSSMAKFLGETSAKTTPQVVSKPASSGVWSKAEMTQFWSWWNGQEAFNQTEILGALNVERLSDWQGTIEQANTAMQTLKQKAG